jgi:hypothetical protein
MRHAFVTFAGVGAHLPKEVPLKVVMSALSRRDVHFVVLIFGAAPSCTSEALTNIGIFLLSS